MNHFVWAPLLSAADRTAKRMAARLQRGHGHAALEYTA
jgi:hypothetical protein